MRYHLKYDDIKLAGALLFVGGVQWFLAILITEGLHPRYASGAYYVSSLGVGATAFIYNPSLILLGITVVAAAYLIERAHRPRYFFVLLILTGLFTMGVGLFPEDVRPMHGIVTPFALIFGALSAIGSFKLQKPPLSYLSVLLGALSLIASAVYFTYLGLPRESFTTYLGLGKGTMGRLIIYPILLWEIGYGSYLIGSTDGSVNRPERARCPTPPTSIP